MKLRPHRLEVPFPDDLARKCIDIHSALAKNVNSMISVDYSSVRPGFQTIPLAGCQGLHEGLGGKPIQLSKLGRDERVLRMKDFQGRRGCSLDMFLNRPYCITRQAA